MTRSARTGAMASGKKNGTSKKAKARVAAAMRDLPARATCPKCGRSRKKEMFGVRVMKRDAQGVPLVVRRQSYCRECRG